MAIDCGPREGLPAATELTVARCHTGARREGAHVSPGSQPHGVSDRLRIVMSTLRGGHRPPAGPAAGRPGFVSPARRPVPAADRRRGARQLLVVTLLVAPALARAQVKKTLDECIEIALEQQPALRADAATVAAGRERVWQVASNYLPQVTANYQANRRHASSSSATGGTVNEKGQITTFPFYSTGLSLTQVLFDFGQNLELIHAAQATADSLAADADTQRDNVVFNVQQSYFALLAAYRLRDVAEQTVVQNEKHLDLAEGRHDVGLAPRFDVTNAQVQVAGAELNQVTARNNVSLARETLRNALGLMGPPDFDICDTLQQHRRA